MAWGICWGEVILGFSLFCGAFSGVHYGGGQGMEGGVKFCWRGYVVRKCEVIVDVTSEEVPVSSREVIGVLVTKFRS